MFKQSLKMMWRRRQKSIFLLLELFMSFLILFSVFAFGIVQWKKYIQPLGFDPTHIGETTFAVEELIDLPFDQVTGAPDSLFAVTRLQNLKRDILQIRGVSELSYMAWQTPFSSSHWQTANETDQEGAISFATAEIVFGESELENLYQFTPVMGRWFKPISEGKYGEAVVNRMFFDKFMKGTHDLGSLVTVMGEKSIVGVIDNFKMDGDFGNEKPTIFINCKDDIDRISKMEYVFDEKENPYWMKDMYKVMGAYFKAGSFTTVKLNEVRKEQSKSTWVLLFGFFAISCFLVMNVAIGLFGALQYAVQHRRGEIGLRKSMGATKFDILGQFVLEMMVLSTFAILLAVLFAIQVPLLNLFDMNYPTAMAAIGITTIFIYSMIVFCSLIPAYRAANILPAVALHDE